MTQVPYTFGNESSPIPLSQLDANFAVVPQYATTAGNVVNATQANITTVGTLVVLSVAGNVNAGNFKTAGSISATGNISVGNIATGGTISAYGNITGGQLSVTGPITSNSYVSASGNVTGGNILTNGRISATGNVSGANITAIGQINSQGNISSQGIISAIGNIVTAANFVGNFLGNITGNISAGGSNTQVFFNLNGLVGAVGGLTYNKDSNTLSVLGVVSAQGNVNAGGNLTVGGNLVVAGTTQLVGIATAPTAPTGTANNQVASTAFVNNQINQYANNVAITGGTIAVSSVTANSVTVPVVTMGTWQINQTNDTLYFTHNGSNIAKLDSSGNFTTIGNVTAFGTI
jgi:hypothetical protein